MKWRFEIEPQLRFGLGLVEDGFEADILFFRLSVKRRNYSWDTTEPRRVVIAGSYQEFLGWCMRSGHSPRMFKLIDHRDHLTDLAGQTVDLYYVGTFTSNPICEDVRWNEIEFRREIYCYE
jgi:hypothetical protein